MIAASVALEAGLRKTVTGRDGSSIATIAVGITNERWLDFQRGSQR
ncbi:hypothetical protein RISK_004517 [Rhodopirellula islandica]|uniref:Uncharacterized protein n=1 Tax=Rhodopirellula islandica TaxID=595434 RepID=A0A0J1B8R1_RHOIS|nr:hypothetical protein RISK_004517 [Rhodopirellula islandica]